MKAPAAEHPEFRTEGLRLDGAQVPRTPRLEHYLRVVRQVAH